MARPFVEFSQLAEACDFLEHYHLDHSDDKITRFRGAKKPVARSADIYIVSDPEWRRKFAEFCASQFPEGK